jgi:hypothetical protein
MTPIETGFLAIVAVLVRAGKLAQFRAYRALVWGAAARTLISALFPPPGNARVAAKIPVGLPYNDVRVTREAPQIAQPARQNA